MTHINERAVAERTASAKQQLGRQNALIKQMQGTIDALADGVWSSPAQRQHADSFNQTRQQIEKFHLALAEYLAGIGTLAGEFAAVDADMRTRLNRI
ncbi:MAG: hypothetical protein FWC27_12950 [Firmicutes bacterium]|nr:hypothetical protein [Bacillota bacterium]